MDNQNNQFYSLYICMSFFRDFRVAIFFVLTISAEKKMKFAIVSSMPHHFECIPCFLDVLQIKYPMCIIDVWVIQPLEDLHWNSFLRHSYRTDYPRISFQFLPLDTKDPDEPLKYEFPSHHYDWIVCPTDVDPIVHKIESQKLWTLQHVVESDTNARFKSATRLFPNQSNPLPVFFPITNCVIRDVPHKQLVYRRREKLFSQGYPPSHLFIAIVGSPRGFQMEVLEAIFANHPHAHFVFLGVCAGIECELPSSQFPRVPTEKLYWMVAACDYVLMNRDDVYYRDVVMSGTLPLSHTCLTPLICPQSFRGFFPYLDQCKSVITYSSEFVLQHPLRRLNESDIEALLKERDELIQQNVNSIPFPPDPQKEFPFTKTNPFHVHLIHWERGPIPTLYFTRKDEWMALNQLQNSNVANESNESIQVRIHTSAQLGFGAFDGGNIERNVLKLLQEFPGIYINITLQPNVPIREWIIPEGVFVWKDLAPNQFIGWIKGDTTSENATTVPLDALRAHWFTMTDLESHSPNVGKNVSVKQMSDASPPPLDPLYLILFIVTCVILGLVLSTVAMVVIRRKIRERRELVS